MKFYKLDPIVEPTTTQLLWMGVIVCAVVAAALVAVIFIIRNKRKK